MGSLRDREVACSASDRQGSNFESCVWRTVSSHSSHHPQEVLLAQFSLYVHKGGLKPDSFHFISTGILPDDWAISIIRPIYKNKGDDTDPNNYRGISLLSCFGKLFTSCLNERLSNFVKAHDTVGPEQAGFKTDNSTIDHIFVLKTLADIYLNKRKRLYCCFVDY